MWADLHYQDARGRLAALKKSKRLARTLEVRSCSNNHNIKAIQQSTKRSSELEFELTQQWRSLFLRTENALVLETAQIVRHLGLLSFDLSTHYMVSILVVS
ncbi:hypothetical protein BHE74_00044496 [Ensete ventricosum]|uniref:Uncharacterized protein n=1 Tax=Ensete ventricosum TaxID=4639 RepID=A0A426WXI8_ENSVE|nr:hypothetical protein B296_00058466 [Ensete ventricosum]RWW49357.1 hypothetical protein BHE74_00044496 [Ensete ventricosum]RZS21712.1 hypothetical protein BHM03_00054387 [Ensete ventricosum]